MQAAHKIFALFWVCYTTCSGYSAPMFLGHPNGIIVRGQETQKENSSCPFHLAFSLKMFPSLPLFHRGTALCDAESPSYTIQ